MKATDEYAAEREELEAMRWRRAQDEAQQRRHLAHLCGAFAVGFAFCMWWLWWPAHDELRRSRESHARDLDWIRSNILGDAQREKLDEYLEDGEFADKAWNGELGPPRTSPPPPPPGYKLDHH